MEIGLKNKLHLWQVQQLTSPQGICLDLGHIATLWKLDRDHDGCVTFQELLDFAEFCNERHKIVGQLDFESKLKAICVMELWSVISEEVKGQDSFASWVVFLASQGDPFMPQEASP